MQRSSVIQDVNRVVITKSKEVKETWKNYFEGLYNDLNPRLDANLLSLPVEPNSEDVPGISIRAVKRAIQGLRLNRGVGYDVRKNYYLQLPALGS